MDTKKTAAIVIAAVLLVTVAAIYYLNTDEPPPPYEPDYLEANEGLFQTEEFDLTDDKTGSWIRGTLYAMTDDDGYPLVRVMATVHIGAGNYYGASISGLLNFVPVCFLSDYHGDPNSTDAVLYDFHDPRSYAVIGTSLTEHEFFGIDEPEFGPDVPMGGDGTVLVDLDPSEHFDEATKIFDWNIAIEIGSKEDSPPITKIIEINHNEVNQLGTSATGSVDTGLNDEAWRNGIVKVTKDQLMSDGPRLGLSDSTIETLVDMDLDVFYFTASAPTCVIVQNDGSVVLGHVHETGFSWSEIT